MEVCFIEGRRFRFHVSKNRSMKNSLRCALLTMFLCAAFPTQAQKSADQINKNGEFVLAAKAGRTERVSALLAEGVAVNSRDRNGDSPLNIAAAKGNDAMAAVLLRANADVNLANLSGVTPLMGASFSGKPELVKKLLSAGARLDPVDRVKKNAAIYAAANGCSACLTELIIAGTAINARLDNDATLLMWAAGYGQEAVVAMLLREGADRKAKDNRGMTAADIARDGNFMSVAKLIEQQ
jgi:ankyrin repeat protein